MSEICCEFGIMPRKQGGR